MDYETTEKRFCDRCMAKTTHNILEEEDIIYTYKRKRLYYCMLCGRKSYKRALRPSAESVY
jgi:hypothetical protein